MSSLDVIATVLQELEPELNDMFTEWHPLLDKIVKGKRLSKVKGLYKEFKISIGGAGSTVKLDYGDEQLAAGRRDIVEKGEVRASRFIHLFDITGTDIAEASGTPAGIKELIRQYPEQSLAELHEDIAAQIARGAGSSGDLARAAGLNGLCTLNGIQDFTIKGTAYDGVFQFAAPASQTNTVFGIPMQGAASGISGWHHKYGLVTSFGSNGRETMRKVRDDANAAGGKMQGKIDLLLGDPQSYQNYVNDLDEHVQVVAVKNDHTPAAIREGVKFGDADFFPEIAIDLSDTTSFSSAVSQSGVLYMLNSTMWDGFTHGDDESMETKGFFSLRGPTRVPDKDAWRWEIVNHWNIFCRSLRNQGLVAGSAVK
jgi:hypothetical protein